MNHTWLELLAQDTISTSYPYSSWLTTRGLRGRTKHVIIIMCKNSKIFSSTCWICGINYSSYIKNVKLKITTLIKTICCLWSQIFSWGGSDLPYSLFKENTFLIGNASNQIGIISLREHFKIISKLGLRRGAQKGQND